MLNPLVRHILKSRGTWHFLVGSLTVVMRKIHLVLLSIAAPSPDPPPSSNEKPTNLLMAKIACHVIEGC